MARKKTATAGGEFEGNEGVESKVLFLDPNVRAIADLFAEVEGLPPGLIMNCFSEKKRQELLGRQTHKKGGKNPPKTKASMLADALNSIHWIGKPAKSFSKSDLKGRRYGFPDKGFIKGMLRGASHCGKVMTQTKGIYWLNNTVEGAEHGVALVEIFTKSGPIMIENRVNVANGNPDVRHRAFFKDWRAKLHIQFNCRLCTAEEVLSWLNMAGICCGIGDDRPSSKHSPGSHGRYQVVSAKAIVPVLHESTEKKEQVDVEVKKAK